MGVLVSGDIEFRGGGAVAVDTDTLRATAVRFTGARLELEQIAARLGHAQNVLLGERDTAWGALSAASVLFARLTETMRDADLIAERLREAAALYEIVDLNAQHAVASAAGDTEAMARIEARRALLEEEYAGITERAAMLEFERAVMWPSEYVRMATEWGNELGGLLEDNKAGRGIEHLVGGPAGVVGGVVAGLGAIVGAAVIGGSRWGLIPRDARLTTGTGSAVIHRTNEPGSSARAPAGLASAARRIPTGAEDRVRVERYTMRDGTTQYAVYVAGTRSADVGRDEVWDNASNVDLATGRASASYQATAAALEAAGARPGDVVHAFGHSQGAMITSHLAVQEGYNTRTLVSFGSPVEADVGPGTLSVSLRHTDDGVALLAGGGHMAPVGAPGSFIVERSPGQGPDTGAPSAHAMSGYVDTARQVDASTDPRVEKVRSVFDELGTARSVEVFVFGAERANPISYVPSAAGGAGGFRRPS